LKQWGKIGLTALALALMTLALAGCRADSGDADSTGPEIVRVERGSLVSAVTAIGAVAPRNQVPHAFGFAGRVTELLVQVGDRVEVGDPLARLDTAELALQVEAAEAARAVAQAQLDRLQAGARPEEIAVARAEVNAAEARLSAAEEDLRELEDDSQATDAQLRAAETNVAVLQAQRDAAQAGRDLLDAGPTSADLAAAEAQLAQADAALDSARLALTQAELTSAIDGLVAQVDVTVGQLVAPQSPTILIIDDSDYQVEVDVDETDIGGVQVGQEVALTLDAFLGRRLTGRVVTIAPVATLDLGIATYRVTVAVDPSDLPLRAGLTVNAEIIRDRRDDVLLVPNLAITVDEGTGEPSVTRQTSAGDEVTAIEIGLSTDLFTEVLAGLEEGDLVVVNTVSYRDQLQQVMESYLQGGDQD
jgi:multidrug efflux pump subunit AcrA (membrane-fusion protein)